MATENNNKNLNVPNLRFPEFSGEWNRIKVSDLLAFYPTNSLSWEQLDYSGEGIFNLHYGLIHKGLPTQVDVSENNLPTIKDEYIPKKMSSCQNGDVAFADTSEDTNDVAKCIEFANCGDRRIVCGLHTIHGRDSLNITIVGFKGYAFAAPAFRQQIRLLAQGTKIYSVSSNNFAECYIGIPSKAEQTKIAELLYKLDKRIATQIKIIEKLESLIKGLCQKLTQQGNPNTALNEALVCCSSTLQESSVQEAGDYPVYGATGLCGYTDAPEVDGDSILIIKDGASVGVTSYASGKYSAIGTLNRLVAKRGYSLRYLYYCLKVFNFAPYRTGLAIPHIYFRDYGKAKVWCPPIEEQKRITDSLLAVDRKIAIEKSLLEQLYSQKRFLLQAMFI